MGNIYTYSREIVNGYWNIDNKERVDGEGNQIYLAKEVEQNIPNEEFKMFANEDICFFDFVNELTNEQKDVLDTTVSNHKNNTQNNA